MIKIFTILLLTACSCLADSLTLYVGNVQGLPDNKVSIPLYVHNFTNIGSFQFSFHWPTNLAAFDSLKLTPKWLFNGNFGTNQTQNGWLVTSWDDTQALSQDLADGMTLFVVTLKLTTNYGVGYVYVDGNPTPIEIPPSTWPSTSIGLIGVPQSWAATMRNTLTSPVSSSTSTSAIWVA